MRSGSAYIYTYVPCITELPSSSFNYSFIILSSYSFPDFRRVRSVLYLGLLDRGYLIIQLMSSIRIITRLNYNLCETNYEEKDIYHNIVAGLLDLFILQIWT